MTGTLRVVCVWYVCVCVCVCVCMCARARWFICVLIFHIFGPAHGWESEIGAHSESEIRDAETTRCGGRVQGRIRLPIRGRGSADPTQQVWEVVRLISGGWRWCCLFCVLSCRALPRGVTCCRLTYCLSCLSLGGGGAVVVVVVVVPVLERRGT
ncbi:uncharacterized protein LY79DRAFT_287297 [Colletotrichum navitas]|uniref:Uncharacterized protein n=1 Tax=Colletotrichum navitas TaxID=681940 RepID=A0AAD8QBR0_9PEZI|nr:uncharacterized protein LY79DRAFT_287297 [Colletotrichum navitas]KAK1598378.1 hypothetical protein LY79DRAFT_287297 [Colletotrichum navitas]